MHERHPVANDRAPFSLTLLITLPWTAAITVLVACGSSDSPRSAVQGLVSQREMRGDTLVVNNLDGSVWGDTLEMVPEVSIGELDGPEEYLLGQVGGLAVADDGTVLVVDRQAPALRAYDVQGKHVRTFGAPGGGPGEYESPDGGIAVLVDGRIALRDPGNGRIMVYDPSGEENATWRLRGGFRTSRSMYRDRDGVIYTSLLVDPEAEIGEWVVGLSQIRPDGSPGDTLVPPDPPLGGSILHAEAENSISRTPVPFSPQVEWTLDRDGGFVWGTTDGYGLHARTEDGRPLLILRKAEPARVAEGERASERRRVTRNLRTIQPNWSWNGPDIPDRKPIWRDVFVSEEGRFWVHRHSEAEEVENPTYDPDEEDSDPTEWIEPVVFDVFGPEGDYLGAVRAPDGFYPSVQPVFRDNQVWAVIRDEFDVPKVIRFRVDIPTD
jgi:hypothetical protein